MGYQDAKKSEGLCKVINMFRDGLEMLQPVGHIAELLELCGESIKQGEPLSVLVCVGGE